MSRVNPCDTWKKTARWTAARCCPASRSRSLVFSRKGVDLSHATIITDLAYGDCGKGTLVDYFVRTKQAGTVVRFNGGAQAAHNVVTADGRVHTFSQFGSGTFVSGVKTYLSRHVLIDPYGMFNEEAHLCELGVTDAFERTYLDRRARIITPYQQVANRLRERARGANRHGSCGIGIGETVADHLQHGDKVLFAHDLPDSAAVKRKLRFLRDTKRAELAGIITQLRDHPAAQGDIAVFDDDTLIEIVAENCASLASRLTLIDEDRARRDLIRDTVIFEGAQGVLLDENYGFAPYTTWSDITFANADNLLRDFEGEVTRLGVLRTYFTRHGAGPFVTEDAALIPHLPEYHNTDSPWQESFRRGWFDVVAARYALEVAGGVDALAITHMDRLDALPQICDAYHAPDDTDLDPYFTHDDAIITAITVRRPPDLDHQARLAHLLFRCTPRYRPVTPATYIDTLESALGVRVTLTSHGATAADKRGR